MLIIEAQSVVASKKPFTEWNAREVAGYNLMNGATSKNIVCHNEFYEEVKSYMQRAEEEEKL